MHLLWKKHPVSRSWLCYMFLLGILCLLIICGIDFRGIALYGEIFPDGQPYQAIYEGEPLEQELTGKNDRLAGIAIRFCTYGRVNHNQVTVTLLQNQQSIHAWQFCADRLSDGQYEILLLPERWEQKKGCAYVVRIETDSGNETASKNDTVSQNDAASQNDTVSKSQTDFNFKKDFGMVTDSEKEPPENVIGVYTGWQEVSSENGLPGAQQKNLLSEGTLAVKTISVYIRARWIAAASVLAVLAVMGIAVFCGFSRMSLKRKYVLLAGAAGIVYLLVVPYGAGADETAHMMRAYEIAQGHLLSGKGEFGNARRMDGNLAPVDQIRSYSDTGVYRGLEADAGHLQTYIFPNTAIYSPVTYLPQVAGLWVAGVFTKQIFWLSFSAKAAGLLFSLLAVSAAFTYLPVRKYCLLVLAMLPMFLHQSAVITGDCFLNGMAVLFPAYVLYLAYRYEGNVGRTQVMALYAGAVLLGLCKLIYLPLAMLVFLVPEQGFASPKTRRRILTGAFAVACAASLFWFVLSSGYLWPKEGVDAAAQAVYVLRHPLRYLFTVMQTVLTGFDVAYWQFFGERLGALNLSSDRTAYYACALLLTLFCLEKEDTIQIRKKDKLILFLTAAAVTGLVFTSEYLQYTPVAAEYIDGIQGRYFIPVALLFCICMENRQVRLKKQNIDIWLFPFMGYLNLYAISGCMKHLLYGV